jgi:hypothetical protein
MINSLTPWAPPVTDALDLRQGCDVAIKVLHPDRGTRADVR